MNQVIQVKKYGKYYDNTLIQCGTVSLVRFGLRMQRPMTMSNQLRYRSISILIGHPKCFFPQWCGIVPGYSTE